MWQTKYSVTYLSKQLVAFVKSDKCHAELLSPAKKWHISKPSIEKIHYTPSNMQIHIELSQANFFSLQETMTKVDYSSMRWLPMNAATITKAYHELSVKW